MGVALRAEVNSRADCINTGKAVGILQLSVSSSLSIFRFTVRFVLKNPREQFCDSREGK